MLDTLIKNVEVFDGTGASPSIESVGIKDGKIVSVSKESAMEANTIIDGTGLSLSPGFIDSHTHSDFHLFQNPSRWEKLKQGITTEIGGQCGWSLAPFPKTTPKEFRDYTVTFLKSPGFDSYKHAMNCLDSMDLGVNQAFFVGHGYIRGVAMGMDNRTPTAKELDFMCAMTEEAMQSGALGLSSGLVYAPGVYANREELIQLAKIVAKYGGRYSTHIRNEGDFLVEAIQEAIEIAKAADVSLNISHLKALFPMNFHKIDIVLEMINKEIEQGMDITFDAYPYAACSATILSTLPPSYLVNGVDWLTDHLRQKENVDLLRKAIYEPTETWENPVAKIGVDNLLVSSAPHTPDAVGKRISEYAKLKGLDDIEAYAEIIQLNHGEVMDIRFAMSEDNIEQIYRHPRCMVGTDGLYEGNDAPSHVRAFASFPRYLGHYIRDRKLLSMEEGIRRISGMPADVYGLVGKGYIKEGYDADLVLFDKEKICDKATYTDPFIPNEGIHMVMINGKAAVINNELTGVMEGRKILRSNERK